MQRLEVSGAVRPLYVSLGVKGLKRFVSKNHRTTATKVTAELNIYLEDLVSTKTF